MNFGSITLKHGLMLAPMAGFSDRAMRLVCLEHGAEYSVTEMVSAKAVTFRDKKTESIAKIGHDEGLCALQIFGSEPDVMARATELIEKGVSGFARPAAIDINMGCPVHKIFSNGEGSSLMKSPELIEQIVKSVKGSTDLPVTVKLRTGIDKSHINAVECALAAERGGASLIALHGRSKEQMYSGDIDRETIKNVKQSLHIPLVANGDITNADSALELLSYTGADGIMIGRGAVGNPFVFEEIKAVLEAAPYTPPTFEERIEVAVRQLEYAVADKGERVAVPEARKQIALYLKGFRGASALRGKINTLTTLDEVKRELYGLIDKTGSCVI